MERENEKKLEELRKKIDKKTFEIRFITDDPYNELLREWKGKTIKKYKSSRVISIIFDQLVKSAEEQKNKKNIKIEEFIAKQINEQINQQDINNDVIKIQFIGEKYSKYGLYPAKTKFAINTLVSILNNIFKNSKNKKIIKIEDLSCNSELFVIKPLLCPEYDDINKPIKDLIKQNTDKIKCLFLGGTRFDNATEIDFAYHIDTKFNCIKEFYLMDKQELEKYYDLQVENMKELDYQKEKQILFYKDILEKSVEELKDDIKDDYIYVLFEERQNKCLNNSSKEKSKKKLVSHDEYENKIKDKTGEIEAYDINGDLIYTQTIENGVLLEKKIEKPTKAKYELKLAHRKRIQENKK